MSVFRDLQNANECLCAERVAYHLKPRALVTPLAASLREHSPSYAPGSKLKGHSPSYAPGSKVE